MENLTFDQLPQAISRIQEKLDAIEDLLKIGKQENQAADEILNITQAAAFLKLSVATIYGRVCRHQIPVYKQGKRLYFYKKELEEWIKSGRKKSFQEIRQEAEERMKTIRRDSIRGRL